ncbi:MAG: PilZ domain-containing protein, partial [Candidatus Xenobia bacterium]
ARFVCGFEAGCRFLDPSAAVAFLKTHWWLDLAGTVQRRQTIRIVRRYRCAFTDDSGRAGTGNTRDFSPTGACISTRAPLAPSSRLSLTLMFRESITVKAEVLRCEETDKDAWDCSVRFLNLTADQQRQLAQVVESLKRDWADGAT